MPALRRDARAIAAIEAALVLPVFLIVLLLILQIAIYFTLQSALDLGVTVTAESLRSQVVAGSAFSPPSVATLKSQVVANGGALLGVPNLTLDVQALATLSAGAVPVTDGSVTWGGSGSILVVRAQTTLRLLPNLPALSMTSAAIVRRPVF